MALKFYTDKHVAKQIAVQLRKKGIDVLRCEEVGLDKASDTAHLEYATEQGRVVVSFDEDYMKLHDEWQATGKRHAGIMRLLRHLQGEDGIGTIVKSLLEYHALIETGAGTVDADIENQVFFIG
ncbi:MAG: DUF5615 family PIN-like protein [Anaerolineae bacterium]|nr:DUF5615 family PIN-like protein [Anaerolineae bacterium]